MSTTKKNKKIVCMGCGSEKVPANFYMNSNPLFSSEMKQLPICKTCIQKYISESSNESEYFNRVVLVLALLNKPYLNSEWINLEKSWEKYIPPISSLPQHKKSQFKDSTFFLNEGKQVEVNEKDFEFDSEVDIQELFSYWGKGYSKEQYEFLEEEKMKLMSSFECPDYGMEMIMRDICFINLDIEKIRGEQRANGSTEISKLIKIRSDLMNDAKMKPIQATGAEANDQLTFGVLIKKWENDKPVPKALEDEMKMYIDTYMVGHLAKMEGLNNEMTEKYDKAIGDYTINFKDVNKDDEFEDE
ncbi:hypothetical protein [Brevibacillus brevis]|uniref:hypothetical protein n=1 Tax=Brevibacillus brevis TaxID=1393 RepID=UPI0007D8B014|nr:hypothetical protein [Brevibacillus brevis]